MKRIKLKILTQKFVIPHQIAYYWPFLFYCVVTIRPVYTYCGVTLF